MSDIWDSIEYRVFPKRHLCAAEVSAVSAVSSARAPTWTRRTRGGGWESCPHIAHHTRSQPSHPACRRRGTRGLRRLLTCCCPPWWPPPRHQPECRGCGRARQRCRGWRRPASAWENNLAMIWKKSIFLGEKCLNVSQKRFSIFSISQLEFKLKFQNKF